jgi:cobalt/nickel transport system ATP-binding protein
LHVTRKTLPGIRKSVGLVFQDPDDQLFMPTVLEDVMFGPLNMGMSSDSAKAAALRALERVESAHLQERPPFKLSAGEKKRAAIAAVLAMSPDILVIDEPSASLDPKARRELIELLRSFEHTKIIATHDLDLAMDVCERTIIMKEGRILADDATEGVFKQDELLSRARLEKPLRMQQCPICSPRQI